MPLLALPPAAAPYRASGLVLWALFGPDAMYDLSPECVPFSACDATYLMLVSSALPGQI
jgi:hypothetical protein